MNALAHMCIGLDSAKCQKYENVLYGDKGEMMSDENKPLSKSAQSVQQVLAKKGLAFEVRELSTSTRTANDAANTK